MTEPDPTAVVADADVLAADLFVGGPARAALDLVRAHAWFDLIATTALLDETEELIAGLSDGDLAAAWRDHLEAEATIVEPTAAGHPALVAAASGEAATVLSFDQDLQSASVGAAIRTRLATSIKDPGAFARMTDPASLYEAIEDESYSGTDRDPRD